jgi:alkylation response protein AidB-like acyl-CoA dehydrogenase
MEYKDALARVVQDVVAPAADEIDRDGVYPRAALDALGKAGILGLLSAEDVGGGGLGLDAAADVIETLATACGSTAMVVLMHYAAAAVLERHGPMDVRRAIAAGEHVSTLAFSEAGSRSHFWAPLSTARKDGGKVRLDAEKSWVTSAGEADSYVWSSKPLAEGSEAPMTLWYVPTDTPGLRVAGLFDGLGLRGNGSCPVMAEGVVIDESSMLGGDGEGLDIALGAALPVFLICSAATSVGFMEATTAATTSHLTETRLAHLDQSLADQPVPRADLARMRVETDKARAFLADTVSSGDQLKVLEVKAACGEAAIAVTDLAMKVSGGSAFRRGHPVERRFRDARAARVMAPTTDALLDFVGRAVCGMPLLGP